MIHIDIEFFLKKLTNENLDHRDEQIFEDDLDHVFHLKIYQENFVLFSREKLGQTCNNLCRTNTNDVLLMLFNTKKRRSFLLIETILNKLRDPLAKDD